MNLTKIQKVKNHIDIKDKLLDLISNTPGEMYTSTSKTDLNYNITFSDWSVKKDHDYKKYYLDVFLHIIFHHIYLKYFFPNEAIYLKLQMHRNYFY